jgi:uncharacterized protein (DUF1330 family)
MNWLLRTVTRKMPQTDGIQGDTDMAYGYLIGEIDVKDPEAYKEYVAGTPAVVAKFGGEFIVRGGKLESMEGSKPAGRVVVIRFPSYEKAKAFYESEDYAGLLSLRLSLTDSRLFLIEGVD